MTSGDDLRDRAETALREAYGFGEVEFGGRLEGGYANDLFALVAGGERLVLRIKHPPVIAEDIAWEHRLTRRLAERLEEVQAPLPARSGGTWFELGDRIAWLVPFTEGEPAEPARAAHRDQAARALGRLHRAGAEIALEARPRLRPLPQLEWPPLRVPPELAGWGETIERERAWAIEHVARVARDRRPPSGLVHGDYFPGNLLLSGDRVTAVLDWEEAQADWLTWDLACAAGTFCEAGDALDEDACGRFVAAYRSAGGTAPPQDDDLILPLIRVKRVLEVLRAPTDRDPRWDHQRHNLRSLANLPRS